MPNSVLLRRSASEGMLLSGAAVMDTVVRVVAASAGIGALVLVIVVAGSKIASAMSSETLTSAALVRHPYDYQIHIR